MSNPIPSLHLLEICIGVMTVQICAILNFKLKDLGISHANCMNAGFNEKYNRHCCIKSNFVKIENYRSSTKDI